MISMRFILNLCFIIVVLSLSHVANALDLSTHPRLQKAVEPLVSEGVYTSEELKQLFSTISLRAEVVKKKQNSAESKLTWGGGYREGGYRGIFLQPDRIEQGVQFWNDNLADLNRANNELGVEPQVISAIIGVETKYGGNKGSHSVFESIATFANRGSKLQTGQLPVFLRLVKKGHLPIDALGSYSGAMGIPQFISTSYRDFGYDFSEDGKVDLISNTTDAIGSVANYFKKHDWRKGAPVMVKVQPSSANAEDQLKQMAVTKINSRSKPKTKLGDISTLLDSVPSDLSLNTPLSVFRFLDENDQAEYFLGLHNFYVIMRYNHSSLYARAVHELSEAILQTR